MNGYAVALMLVIMLMSGVAGWLIRHVADISYKQSERKKRFDAAEKRFDSTRERVDSDIAETRRRMGRG